MGGWCMIWAWMHWEAEGRMASGLMGAPARTAPGYRMAARVYIPPRQTYKRNRPQQRHRQEGGEYRCPPAFPIRAHHPPSSRPRCPLRDSISLGGCPCRSADQGRDQEQAYRACSVLYTRLRWLLPIAHRWSMAVGPWDQRQLTGRYPVLQRAARMKRTDFGLEASSRVLLRERAMMVWRMGRNPGGWAFSTVGHSHQVFLHDAYVL